VSATIVARSETSFTVQVEIPYGSSMLDFEQAIQDRLNQAGVVATQEALQRFACLGNSTDSATLAVVRGGTAEAVHADLWDAVREGLVYRRGDSYRFLHDRVQEAAYILIPEDRRPEEHVRIGRRMSEQGVNSGQNLLADGMLECFGFAVDFVDVHSQRFCKVEL